MMAFIRPAGFFLLFFFLGFLVGPDSHARNEGGGASSPDPVSHARPGFEGDSVPDKPITETRAGIALLGLFEGGVSEIALKNIAALSSASLPGAPVRITKQSIEQLVSELQRAGLVLAQKIPVSTGALRFIAGEDKPPRETFHEKQQIAFYRFASAVIAHAEKWRAGEEGNGYHRRYRDFYYGLAGRLYHLDFRDPGSARAIAERELPNLRSALRGMRDARDRRATVFAIWVEHFLHLLGQREAGFALLGKVENTFEKSIDGVRGPLTRIAFLIALRQGERLMAQSRYRDAESLFRVLLRRVEQDIAYGGSEAVHDRAMTLSRLGRSLWRQGRPDAASERYREALVVLTGPDPEDYRVRWQTGSVRAELADALMLSGQHDRARMEYEKSLAIKQEIGGDPQGEGIIARQLGALALRRGEYEDARERYQAALEKFRQTGESRDLADMHHQLGTVLRKMAGSRKQEAPDNGLLTQAEAHYRQAFQIRDSLGDRIEAAQSAGQLALVFASVHRYADAEDWYRRSIALGERAGEKQALPARYNALAALLRKRYEEKRQDPSGDRGPVPHGDRDLLAEAEQWANKALRLQEGGEDSASEIWKTYGTLAAIATARAEQDRAMGREADAEEHDHTARRWRARERKSYVEFPGHWLAMQSRWAPIVMAIRVGVQGDKATRKAVGRFLDGIAQTDEGAHLSGALRALFDGAHRDPDRLAEEYSVNPQGYLLLKKILE